MIDIGEWSITGGGWLERFCFIFTLLTGLRNCNCRSFIINLSTRIRLVEKVNVVRCNASGQLSGGQSSQLSNKQIRQLRAKQSSHLSSKQSSHLRSKQSSQLSDKQSAN